MASNEEYIRKNKVVIVDDDKNTKLHYAAALGNLEEIEKIVAKKQKLDPENYLGWTPLMMAVRNSNAKAVDLLLSHGADTTKQNKFGMSVFLMSVASGDLDMVERLLNHLLWGGVSRQVLEKTLSPLSLAILFGHERILKYLLERRFDPNAATPLTAITPAMFAVAVANNKAMKRLLLYNADTSLKNCLGKTASDIAQTRHKKIDIAPTKQAPNLPVFVISPHTPNSPVFQVAPNFGHLRKSSNTLTPNTPNFLCANITPIAPMGPQMMPQVFFPPNFSLSNFASPMGAYDSSNHSFFNATMTPSTMFFSPFA
ncbi:ankyrin repeat and SAM domain-containing protein 6-like [Tribolium madens]|uniref:ankyrin repeat and SAM domain-containing protein 6-like n=1 Tax=Tribolium madens TaxID=41895 RepID=UPI001CF75D3D|nr:ankyrin repeat and SAM domain-containing protein 6-like [Tribolium madens]